MVPTQTTGKDTHAHTHTHTHTDRQRDREREREKMDAGRYSCTLLARLNLSAQVLICWRKLSTKKRSFSSTYHPLHIIGCCASSTAIYILFSLYLSLSQSFSLHFPLSHDLPASLLTLFLLALFVSVKNGPCNRGQQFDSVHIY